MLLQHPWLAPLKGMNSIQEDDEAEEAAEKGEDVPEKPVVKPEDELVDENGEKWVDKEVGEWVREQLRKRREGLLGKRRQPALHAAPLDAVPSPVKVTEGAVAV